MNANDGRGVEKRKVTVDDIRRTYPAEKSHADKIAQSWVYIALRPLSFHLTPIFINLGFSANAVTFLGLLHMVAAAVCLVLGFRSNIYFILGAVLANVWYLFDVIDGNIARFRGNANKFGELFDWWTGVAGVLIFPTSLGLGLYLAGLRRPIFDFGLGLPGWSWLLMGTIQAFVSILRSVVSLSGRIVLEEGPQRFTTTEISLWSVMPRAIISFQKPLQLVAAFTGLLGVFLAFYTAYSVATFAAMIPQVLLRARRADSKQISS